MQRRQYRDYRRVQSRRPSGQADRVEQQRLRDRNGLAPGRGDAGRAPMARAQETAHGPAVRRDVLVGDHNRLGGFVSDGAPAKRRQHMSRGPAQDHRARPHTARGSGQPDIRPAFRLLTQEHRRIDVSSLIVYFALSGDQVSIAVTINTTINSKLLPTDRFAVFKTTIVIFYNGSQHSFMPPPHGWKTSTAQWTGPWVSERGHRVF